MQYTCILLYTKLEPEPHRRNKDGKNLLNLTCRRTHKGTRFSGLIALCEDSNCVWISHHSWSCNICPSQHRWYMRITAFKFLKLADCRERFDVMALWWMFFFLNCPQDDINGLYKTIIKKKHLNIKSVKVLQYMVILQF